MSGNKRNNITKDTLDLMKQELKYDPDTGHFYWIVAKGSRSLSEPIGHRNTDEYLKVRYQGKGYLLHRLAFAFMGKDVPWCVDHINGDKKDNRWCNLRGATYPQNTVNSNLRSDNTQNYRGIVNHKQCNGWTAQGSDENGKRVHLGVFTSKDEAALAYNYHAKKVYGPYAKFNQVFDY